jgi:hypothetical protein
MHGHYLIAHQQEIFLIVSVLILGTMERKYVGEWQNNQSHGQGTQTWANGDKYVGEWQNDNRTGQGTHTWANGDKYVGEWQE